MSLSVNFSNMFNCVLPRPGTDDNRGTSIMAMNCVELAVFHNKIDILEKLFHYIGAINVEAESPIDLARAKWLAAYMNHTEIVELLFNYGVDYSFLSSSKEPFDKIPTGLHAAIKNNHVGMVKVLICQREDIHFKGLKQEYSFPYEYLRSQGSLRAHMHSLFELANFLQKAVNENDLLKSNLCFNNAYYADRDFVASYLKYCCQRIRDKHTKLDTNNSGENSEEEQNNESTVLGARLVKLAKNFHSLCVQNDQTEDAVYKEIFIQDIVTPMYFINENNPFFTNQADIAKSLNEVVVISFSEVPSIKNILVTFKQEEEENNVELNPTSNPNLLRTQGFFSTVTTNDTVANDPTVDSKIVKKN